MIMVRVGDTARLAVYRDGPRPAIGSYLQVVQTGPDTASPYLALPLPQPLAVALQAVDATCLDDVFYVSARSAGGADAILRLDAGDRDTITLTNGDTLETYPLYPYDPGYGSVITPPHWTKVSDSPVPGYATRPLLYVTLAGGARRWFTWGVGADMAGGSTLYRSDDECATWAATGLTGCVWLDKTCWHGRMYATDGASVYTSTDYGATWAALPTSTPGDGSPWLYISQQTGSIAGGLLDPDPTNMPALIGVSTTGVWKTISAFRSDRHETRGGYTGETYRRVQGPYGPAPGQRRVSFQFINSQWWYRFDATRAGATTIDHDTDDTPNYYPGTLDPHWSWNSDAYDFGVSKPIATFTDAIPGDAAAHFSFANTHILNGNTFGGAALDYAEAAVRFYAAENQPYNQTPDLLDLGVATATDTAAGSTSRCFLAGLDDGAGEPHTPFALGRFVGGGRVDWPDGFTRPGPRNNAYGTLHFEDVALLLPGDLGDSYRASRYGIVGLDVTR